MCFLMKLDWISKEKDIFLIKNTIYKKSMSILLVIEAHIINSYEMALIIIAKNLYFEKTVFKNI